ncbi:MAG: complex I subunit 1 family protein [Candidatus Margulisiibacteriota bacterium]
MEGLKIIFFNYFILPGFLFSAVIGLLSTWVDRKVTARLQWRKGPPWFQPFADIAKLFGKEIIVPEGGSTFVFLAAPLVGLSAITLVSTILWMSNVFPAVGFVGDLFVVLYLLTVPSLSAILGASASKNPFAALGASREMKLILAYELPFLLSVLTIVYKTGSIVLGNIIGFQAQHGITLFSLSGIIAFIVVLFVVQAKLGYVPFDAAEAEQEIISGIYTEYSGPALGIFKFSRAILLFVLPVLMITLFMGGINILSPLGILWFVVKYVIILTLIILIKNTNPRLRIDQALRFFWGPITCLAALGFILAMIGW